MFPPKICRRIEISATRWCRMEHFIFICMDGADVTGRRSAAKRIALDRAQDGRWPLYKGTGHTKTLSAGDHCLLYVGGVREGGQAFIGDATIERVIDAPSAWRERDEKLISEPA